MFYVVTQNLWNDTDRLCKNCVSHFLCFEKNAKTCDCLYLLLCHNKITINEKLNGFIVGPYALAYFMIYCQFNALTYAI